MIRHLLAAFVLTVVPWPGIASDVAVNGGLAVVAAGAGGLRVVDAVDPTRPVEIGAVDTPGSAYFITVVDVSDPTSPTQLGFVETLGAPDSLAFREGYVFATTKASMLVIDCRNPMAPEVVTSLELDGHSHSLVLGDRMAYVASGPRMSKSISAAMRVFDIRNPLRPRAVALNGTPGWGRDVAVSGDHVYIADGDAGLVIFDVSSCGLPEPRESGGRVAASSP